MALHADIYTLGADANLRNRLVSVVEKQANVLYDATPQVAGPSLDMAKRLLANGPGSVVPQFALKVANNATAQTKSITGPGTVVQANTTDSDLEFIVLTNWARVAGG